MFEKNEKIQTYSILKFIIAVILLLIIIIGLKYLDIFSFVAPEELKTYLMKYNTFAPLVYILLFTFVPLTFFPDSILAIAGGLAFGLYKGTIYTVIGAALGGSLAFYLSRILGYNVINKITKGKVDKVTSILDNKGFIIILILRLIPLFPFDVISYGAGFSKVKYIKFISATIIGIIPGVLVFTNIGANSLYINSCGFYLSIAFLILLLLFSKCLLKYVTKKDSTSHKNK